MISKTLHSIVYSITGLAVLACGETDQINRYKPFFSKKISCHVAFRKSVRFPIEKSTALSFSTSVEDEKSFSAGPFEFHAQYWTGALDGERALRVWVTLSDQAEPLTSSLYQLHTSDGPYNQFRGPHGFTGLNYIYEPKSGNELQFWCEASS